MEMVRTGDKIERWDAWFISGVICGALVSSISLVGLTIGVSMLVDDPNECNACLDKYTPATCR